jgi:hypothetical protein
MAMKAASGFSVVFSTKQDKRTRHAGFSWGAVGFAAQFLKKSCFATI